MNGYETVYTPAPDSKAGLRGHECRPKKDLYYTREISGLAAPSGSIVCCDRCGQHWYRYIWPSGGSGLHTAKWYKVRWYHVKKRRRILGID